VKRLLGLVDRWLFTEYSARADDLAVYRVLYASYVLVGVLPAGLWIRELPQAAFSPPMSPMAFFRHYPPYGFMVTVNVVALLLASALLLGWRTKVASFGLALGMLVLRAVSYADGKIDNDILVVLIPLLFGFSGWGTRFSLDARRQRSGDAATDERRAWLGAIFALLIGLAFWTAGSAKLRGGWLSLHTHATLSHLLPNFYVTGRHTLVAGWALVALPWWAWKAMDLTTVAWESTFVLAVPRRTAFRIYCAIGALFHFGVWQLFGITVAINAIGYAAFVPWARLFRLPPAEPSQRTLTILLVPTLAIILLSWIKMFVFEVSQREAVESCVEVGVILVALLIGVAYLLSCARSVVSYVAKRDAP
jgi:uncharacterized membrane protein YphA (DoxX/SURF4 family)